jgi:hypothetical protein
MHRTGDFTRLERRHIAGCRPLLKSLVLGIDDKNKAFCSGHNAVPRGRAQPKVFHLANMTCPVNGGLGGDIRSRYHLMGILTVD